MLRKVCLHGALGEEFGPVFELDVSSCAEAVRALCSFLPGFRAHVEKGYYRVVRGDNSEGEAPGDIHLGLGNEVQEIHIFPTVAGAKDDGISKVIFGALLIAASFAIPGSAAIFGKSISSMVGMAGLSAALGGIGMMVSGQDRESGESDQSDLFSGSPNQAVPGSAIPVVFGQVEVDVKIISAAVHLEDRVTGARA